MAQPWKLTVVKTPKSGGVLGSSITSYGPIRTLLWAIWCERVVWARLQQVEFKLQRVADEEIDHRRIIDIEIPEDA